MLRMRGDNVLLTKCRSSVACKYCLMAWETEAETKGEKSVRFLSVVNSTPSVISGGLLIGTSTLKLGCRSKIIYASSPENPLSRAYTMPLLFRNLAFSRAPSAVRLLDFNSIFEVELCSRRRGGKENNS